MSYCPNCGTETEPNAVFCAQCGTNLRQQYQSYQNQPYQNQPSKPDVPSTGLKVLCFFFPIVGLILFCVMQKEQPICAKAYGKMALISFIISMVLSILYVIIFVVFAATAGPYMYDSFDVYSYAMNCLPFCA